MNIFAPRSSSEEGCQLEFKKFASNEQEKQVFMGGKYANFM